MTIDTSPAAEQPPPPALPPQKPAAPRRMSWLAISILAFGVILTVLFGLRAMRSFTKFRDVRGRPPLADISGVRPWMTLGMVADLFEIDEDRLYEEMRVPKEGNTKRTLLDLEKKYNDSDRRQFRRRLELAVTRLTMPPPHEGPPNDEGHPPPPDEPPAAATAPAVPAAEATP